METLHWKRSKETFICEVVKRVYKVIHSVSSTILRYSFKAVYVLIRV